MAWQTNLKQSFAGRIPDVIALLVLTVGALYSSALSWPQQGAGQDPRAHRQSDMGGARPECHRAATMGGPWRDRSGCGQRYHHRPL